ncbi:hypothetical protein D4764_04G0013000 [Takifugu flavidus]|uniref:Uncharacterized protein n=1 Tax=Takifugu flavidus TaxID=433684 RepID=A0A5C6N638_9TELE|nr:hypothetical protein D4764_04G0013000 [Takifugu flavidus]
MARKNSPLTGRNLEQLKERGEERRGEEKRGEERRGEERREERKP